MRYSQGHRAETREIILDTAARQFRESGIDGVGIAGLMKQAGLTHGGFYNHFKSKEELVIASLEKACADMRAELSKFAKTGGIAAIVRGYLTPAHRDHPALGCPFASLAADMQRRPPEFRQQVDMLYAAHVTLLADHLGDHAPHLAHSLLARLIGGLQLSRLIADKDASTVFLAQEADNIIAWLDQASNRSI